MAGYVDWEFAKTTGRTLVPAGPAIGPDEAAAEVEAIREAARAAYGPVAETSRLSTPPDSPEAIVVDRPTWISMNADSMQALLDPAIDDMIAAKGHSEPNALVAAIGGKVTGAEVGGLLAFMAGKVLGQYDLAPGGTPQLMLVAPNLVQVQRELDVDAADFRAWVCMHEETHRVQFTAVPWLRDHLVSEARRLVVDLAPDPDRVTELARDIVQRLPADVVMDDVGPAHIPSVATIRARFNERRKGAGAADRLLRRLLGLEAKMRQYRDGAVFVRGVQESVGVEGFNAVWTSPETLPLAAEITDPQAWVRRVHE